MNSSEITKISKFYIDANTGHGRSGFYYGRDENEAYEAFVAGHEKDALEFGTPGDVSLEEWLRIVRAGRGVCNFIHTSEKWDEILRWQAEYQEERG